MPGRGYRKPKAILKCPDCPYTTERVGVFEDHRRVHTGDRPFKCDICGKGFTQKSNLGQHLKVHGAGKQHQFKCNLCDFVTKWKTSLHIHQRMHSGEKPYKCTLCDKAFSQSTHRRTHMKESHQEERKFQCEICSKCFKRQDHLDRHMLFHNNARNHECSVCKKRFNDRRSLKVHGMIHQGEVTKIYTCDLCPYKARYRQALKIHYRFHSGVRPYTCDYCTKTFVTSQTKKLHMILVHKGFASKIFACEQCNYTTPYKPHLKNHINKVHLGIKDRRTIKCLYCHKVYSNHGSLITHKRKKHARQFQREVKAKHEKKVLFMKACAEKVQCSVGEDLKLDTLTSVSQNEEKHVQEYLDSIQAYLKNRMDQVSVPNYTVVKTSDPKCEPNVGSKSGNNIKGPRASRHKTKAKSESKLEAANVKISKLVPRVELERLTLDGTRLDTKEHYNLCGNKVTNPGPRKKKQRATSHPITKLVNNKPPRKQLSKKLPQIVLKLPVVRKTTKLKAKQTVGPRKTKCAVSNKASCNRAGKKSPRQISQPPIVYESDSNYSVPVCTGTSIGKYQVIGTIVSRNVPSSLSKTASTSKEWQQHVIKSSLGALEPKGASQIVLRPSTHRNPMKEFDSLRALASSYVEASEGVDAPSTDFTSVCPIKTEPVDAVVPMSLISHSDAVQRGPFAEGRDSVDQKSDITLNLCNIYNEPD